MRAIFRCYTDAKLLGSPKIIREIADFELNSKNATEILSFCDKLMPLMAEELQGFDVYKEAGLSEQKTAH